MLQPLQYLQLMISSYKLAVRYLITLQLTTQHVSQMSNSSGAQRYLALQEPLDC